MYIIYPNESNVLEYYKIDLVNNEGSEADIVALYLSRHSGGIIVADIADIPPDAEYGLAWELDQVNKQITINMEKAKDIKRDFLRRERESAFIEVDAAYIKALSQGQDLTSVQQRQQYLRDITSAPEIDNATTIDDLKAITIVDWQN